MRYLTLILVFALAGCVSPEKKAEEEFRADSLARVEQALIVAQGQARNDSLSRARARADSLAIAAEAERQRREREAARVKARAAAAEWREKEAEIQRLVARAFDVEASGLSTASRSSSAREARVKARDARQNGAYARAMAAEAEDFARLNRMRAEDATAEEWAAWNRAAEAWERVAEVVE